MADGCIVLTSYVQELLRRTSWNDLQTEWIISYSNDSTIHVGVANEAYQEATMGNGIRST